MKSKHKLILLLGTAAVFIGAQRCTPGPGEDSGWEHTGADEGVSKYSAQEQINKSNVAKLKVAWIFKSGDTKGNVQMNPIIVKGVMYVTAPKSVLIAVNAETGKEIWRFDPSRTGEKLGGVNRGVAYWTDGEQENIYVTSSNYLNAVDAKTGKPLLTFGDSGRIDMNEGLVRPASEMGLTSPGYPVVYKGMVIIGGMSWSAPSNVSSFDAKTGKRYWVFHVIPQPGEAGYETWADKSFWKNGAGVNVWGGLSVDSKNGMVYFSTGQPKDDFYRADNKGGQLYGNCVVALNANTGKKVWHYQAVHHDIWDLDLPCAPILADLFKNGQKVPGLVQLSKTGNAFLFNRLTGELLSKVKEVPVPASTLPGESAYPTQPMVTWPEPFSRQVFTKDDITTLTPEAHEEALAIFNNANSGWFMPPSLKGGIYYGIHGGAEWGGGSYDPENGMVYVNANELAWQIKMHDINSAEDKNTLPGMALILKNGCVGCHGAKLEGMGAAPNLGALILKYKKPQVVDIVTRGRGAMPAFSHIPKDDIEAIAEFLLDIKGPANTKTIAKDQKPVYRSLGYVKFLDKNGYPATKPPYGTLNAINLKTGKIQWKVPLGEYPELTKRGIPQTGTENFGGSIVTKGGLIFIGATRDQKFRAFDKATGKVLWETQLPFGGYATPSTYVVNGKQYVVIAATGGGKLGTTTGDTYVAFALPDK
jgi:quinoprotein glucose dehydrogenase